MDEVEAAAVQSDYFLKHALNKREHDGPQYTGFCAYCGDAVEAPKRWCDADCRDLWDKFMRRKDGS